MPEKEITAAVILFFCVWLFIAGSSALMAWLAPEEFEWWLNNAPTHDPFRKYYDIGCVVTAVKIVTIVMFFIGLIMLLLFVIAPLVMN